MPKLTADQITEKVKQIGLKAILANKKAKRLAAVNHEDNFALAMGRDAMNAVMDEVCVKIDSQDKAERQAWVDWYNAQVNSQDEYKTKLYAMCREIGRTAYQQLRKP